MKRWIFLISFLHDTVKSAKDFISYLELAIFSKLMMTSFNSITDSQFSINWLMISMISCRKSWIFYTCHYFVKIVIKRNAYCFDKFLKFPYMLQMLMRKPLRSASSKVSVAFLLMLIMDFRASSWMWSAEYLLRLVCCSILFVRSMKRLALSCWQISSFSVMLWKSEKIFYLLVSVVVSYFYSNCLSISR